MPTSSNQVQKSRPKSELEKKQEALELQTKARLKKIKSQIGKLKSKVFLLSKTYIGLIVFILLGFLVFISFLKTYSSFSIANPILCYENTVLLLNKTYLKLY